MGFLITKQAQTGTLRMEGTHCSYNIGYASTEVSERGEKNEFYGSLIGVLCNVNGGDINAQLCSDNRGLDPFWTT